eukprot:14830753-Heterocapsa_arctica.AAC.1
MEAPPDQGRLKFVVDTKIVAGVNKFDGEDTNWRPWAREFVVAVSNLGMDELMALCDEHGTGEKYIFNRTLSTDALKLMSKG